MKIVPLLSTPALQTFSSKSVKRIEFLSEKWEMDRISEINHAKKFTEIKTKIETAKKLLEKGMDIDSIMEVTDLSKEEIEKIIDENK